MLKLTTGTKIFMKTSDALGEVGKFASMMVTRPGTTEEDAVKIGAALLVAAEEIFKAVGGSELAATEFYAAADRCATPKD